MPSEAQPTWACSYGQHAHPTHARRESMPPSRCLQNWLNATLAIALILMARAAPAPGASQSPDVAAEATQFVELLVEDVPFIGL